MPRDLFDLQFPRKINCNCLFCNCLNQYSIQTGSFIFFFRFHVADQGSFRGEVDLHTPAAAQVGSTVTLTLTVRDLDSTNSNYAVTFLTVVPPVSPLFLFTVRSASVWVQTNKNQFTCRTPTPHHRPALRPDDSPPVCPFAASPRGACLWSCQTEGALVLLLSSYKKVKVF